MATTMDEARPRCGGGSPGVVVYAPAVLLFPHTGRSTAEVGARSAGRAGAGAVRLGGAVVGRWYHGRAAARSSISASTTCGLAASWPRAPGDGVVGTAIPERSSKVLDPCSDDNARLCSTRRGRSHRWRPASPCSYRSPAIKLTAPAASCRCSGRLGAGGLSSGETPPARGSAPRGAPGWSWTAGLDHLVDCIERGVAPVMRPEHSLHALEVMLAAAARRRAGDRPRDGFRPRLPTPRPRAAATGECTTLAAPSERRAMA
jgi:hypothetical protein